MPHPELKPISFEPVGTTVFLMPGFDGYAYTCLSRYCALALEVGQVAVICDVNAEAPPVTCHGCDAAIGIVGICIILDVQAGLTHAGAQA